MRLTAWVWTIFLCSWALLGFKPAGTGALTGKVDMYVSQGRSDEALALLDRIIATDADNVDAYFSRAFLNLKLSRHDWAIADFTRIITLRPNDPAAYLSRGLTFDQLQDFDRAASDFRFACSLGDQSGCSFAEQLSRRAQP